ncbi:SpoIIE family protein phosphatase [Nocardioides sp. SYSU D00038]|uniref:SpoIIE family protein phosphatase n=1 Tax=Nocardioides sp. SYSU D00038 TaxID=2812554 RepID=UPI001967BF6C|nr:SpoIIE family protein phosphatase [Nocardioides sp. SYSU D00038]
MDGTSIRRALAAGGQVGQDLLAVDWDATPLGPPESWSLSLRNAVRILVTSKFSMWMAWGPELTFFCNDAYRRDTLGTKYPWALGRPASEVWSEIWDDIGPRIERVMATGEATFDERLLLFLERSGYVEETYHTFSYSPLADDDARVNGFLCVVIEETDQIVASRRIATLRDLGIRSGAAEDEVAAVRSACATIAANPWSVPFAAVYLFDDDGEVATLTGTAGIEAGHPAAPRAVRRGDPGAAWPLEPLWAGESLRDRPEGRFGALPKGAWPGEPEELYLVPLLQPTHDHPHGFLMVAVNRYRPFEPTYTDFVGLVASHISAAISDALAIEEEKQRAERLAELDRAKSDFFANVSHELRTPLTLLLAPAEDALASGDDPLPPRQHERVSTIVRNGQRMLQLVNTLLDFSRLESGQARAEYRHTDLCALTNELAAMFDSAAQGSGLAFDVQCSDAWAWVDRDQWAKIVLNLLSNAFKFTFEGRIEVGVGAEDDQVVLTVSDTGAGIPEAELPHLFERFHRVAGTRSRTHEGSGIGLALVAELVQAHGGTIDVTSRVEEGTTFVVRVPVGPGHLPADQLVEDDAPLTPVTQDGQTRQLVAQSLSWLDDDPALAEPPPERDGRPRVLVVDDNGDMRRYIADTLDREVDVVVAEDGVAALEQMAREQPDLVVTDVMMPRLDGFGLLQRMRRDPGLAAVPVIMLSARAGEEGMIEGLEAGADDYLVKPFSGRELLARVRVTLALDREQRAREAVEQSQELLDQAQRLARVGSWEINADDDTLVASRTFLEMLELTVEEIERLGATEVVESRVHPDDLDRVRGELARAVPGQVLEYETRIVLPSGDQRIFHVRGEVRTDADEARVLRGSFQDVTEQRATQERLVAAETERQVAHGLQASLLPASDFVVDPLDVAATYRAGVEGTQVGGDWYDVIDLGAGRTAFVIGDVMGRGIRAAAVMGQLKAAVRAYATLDLPPAEVLEHLDHLVQDVARDEIVTCVYAIFDAATRTLTYANAGHLPPLVVPRAGSPLAFSTDVTGPPLGAGFYGVEAATVELSVGDTVALYTDGLVERRGTDLMDGIDALSRELGARRDRPFAGLPEELVGALVGDDADDDIALVLLRVRPDRDRVMELRLNHAGTAPGTARQAVGRQLREWGIGPSVVDDVVLVTSELVTNALVHARPPIDLAVRANDGRVQVEVRDRAVLRPRRRRPDDDDEHGRGLNIVEALADDWGTHAAESGKTVWCSLASVRERDQHPA